MKKNSYDHAKTVFEEIFPKCFDGHALIAGTTGTRMFDTSIFQLQSILKENKQKVVIFDSGVNEKSYANTFDKQANQKCLSFSDKDGKLKYDILRVPDSVRPKQWLECLTESIVLGYGLGQKAYDILYKQINSLYSRFNVYDTPDRSRHVTVRDLINEISKDSNTKQSFAYEEVRSALVHTLESLVPSYSAEVLPNRIVLDSEKGSLFIIELLYDFKEVQHIMFSLFLKSISEANSNFKKENKEKEKIIFFFDELRDIAQTHFKKDTTQSTYIEQVFLRGRSFDISIMGKTSSIEHLPHYMVANARTLIFHRTVSLDNFHFLNEKEKREITELNDDEFMLYRFGEITYVSFENDKLDNPAD